MRQTILTIGIALLVLSTQPNATQAASDIAQSERYHIDSSGGLAERAGSVLTLRIANGKTVSFISGENCGEDTETSCVDYYLADYLPVQRAFLVSVIEYESYSYKWVNALNGTVTDLPDEPHFSPDGNRFVIVSSDESEMNYDGVQIWRWNLGEITKEWEKAPTDRVYNFDAWDGSNRIRLLASASIAHELFVEPFQIDDLPAQLVQTSDATWNLIPPSKDAICAGMATITERTICRNPELQAAEDNLQKVVFEFPGARNNMQREGEIGRDQMNWREWRNLKCTDASENVQTVTDCVKRAHSLRWRQFSLLGEAKSVSNPLPAPPDNWWGTDIGADKNEDARVQAFSKLGLREPASQQSSISISPDFSIEAKYDCSVALRFPITFRAGNETMPGRYLMAPLTRTEPLDSLPPPCKNDKNDAKQVAFRPLSIKFLGQFEDETILGFVDGRYFVRFRRDLTSPFLVGRPDIVSVPQFILDKLSVTTNGFSTPGAFGEMSKEIDRAAGNQGVPEKERLRVQAN